MANLKVGIPVTILLLLAGIIAAARLLHALKPKSEIIVSSFELPLGNNVQWTGKTAANLFVDELQQIIRGASEFHGTSRFASKRQYQQVPDLPKIPIETNFELQFEGVSLKQVMSAWDYLRYDQKLFSGDIILNEDQTLTVRTRVISSEQAQHWEVSELENGKKIPKTSDGLKEAMRRLTTQVVASLNAETIGRYFLQLQKFEKAQKVFEQWARQEPTRPQPFFYLAYAYGRIPGRLEDGRRAAEQALENDSSYYLAIGQIAWTADQEAFAAVQADRPRRFAEAINKHKEALQASRKWWQFWKKGPPNYWNNLCVEYREIGAFDQAEDACHQAKRSDPDYAGATVNLGLVYERRAEREKTSNPKAAAQDLRIAADAYRTALKQQPDLFEALHYLRLVLLKSSGNGHDEAIKACKKVMAVFPWAAEPLTELGRVYANDGNRPLALEYYRLATERDPNNPFGWSALAEAELNMGSYEKASADFRQALKFRHDAFALAGLGAALVEQGPSAEGMSNLKEVLNLVPSYAELPWFERYLGDAFFGLNDFKGALSAYTAAEEMNAKEHKLKDEVSLLSEFPPFERRLGDTYFELGDFTRAADCYKAVQGWYTEDPKFKARLARALRPMSNPN
jgi:tetratricopeptide (TPR) repeat protein